MPSTLWRLALRPCVRAAWRRQARAFGRLRPWEQDDGFYANHLCSDTVDGCSAPKEVTGELLDAAMDLRCLVPGEVIEVPYYEVTVNEAVLEMWASAFHTTNRLVTSRPFAQKLGFPDQLLPFNLLLFLAGSMSHADRALIQLGFRNARYLTPAHPGDTLRKTFVFKSRRFPKSRPDSTLVALECRLHNQRNELVFAVEKSMLFPRQDGDATVADSSSEEKEAVYEGLLDDALNIPPPAKERNVLRQQIVSHAEELPGLSKSIRQWTPGRLVVHGACRPMTATQSMQLATMGRVVHDRHFNEKRYEHEAEPSKRLYVPGALAFSLVSSLAARELHEVLFQTLHDVSFTAPLHPGEVVAAVSYVRSRAESVSSELEKLEVVTVGIKNVGDATKLTERPFPTALFLADRPLRTADIKGILADDTDGVIIKPEQVVLQAHRSIYRAAPKSEPFLL